MVTSGEHDQINRVIHKFHFHIAKLAVSRFNSQQSWSTLPRVLHTKVSKSLCDFNVLALAWTDCTSSSRPPKFWALVHEAFRLKGFATLLNASKATTKSFKRLRQAGNNVRKVKVSDLDTAQCCYIVVLDSSSATPPPELMRKKLDMPSGALAGSLW